MTEVPQLSEDKGIDLGSQLLAEMLFTATASGFAYNEYAKHKAREASKDEEEAGFFEAKKSIIDDLEERVAGENEELSRVLTRLSELKLNVERLEVEKEC